MHLSSAINQGKQYYHTFTYQSLLRLIDSNNELNKFDLLENCLRLTKNLFRRITIRCLSKTYHCTNIVSKMKLPIRQRGRLNSIAMFSQKELDRMKPNQVTIASYCYETFKAVLSYLQAICTTSNLVIDFRFHTSHTKIGTNQQ